MFAFETKTHKIGVREMGRINVKIRKFGLVSPGRNPDAEAPKLMGGKKC